jgi:P27 family predicted phage terminase small subunit
MRPRIDLATHKTRGTKPQYVLADSDTPAGRPKVPKSLSDDGKRTFKRLAKMLAQRRTLTAGDQEILRLYATAFDRHARAVEHLAKEGEIVISQRTTKSGELFDFEEENKWLSIAQNSEKYMRGLLSDLGLNPLQRSRVKQTEVKKPDDAELPTKEETVLPEPEPLSLYDIDESVVGNDAAQTISPEVQALLDEADAALEETDVAQ